MNTMDIYMIFVGEGVIYIQSFLFLLSASSLVDEFYDAFIRYLDMIPCIIIVSVINITK